MDAMAHLLASCGIQEVDLVDRHHECTPLAGDGAHQGQLPVRQAL